jgi:hypothetical protein
MSKEIRIHLHDSKISTKTNFWKMSINIFDTWLEYFVSGEGKDNEFSLIVPTWLKHKIFNVSGGIEGFNLNGQSPIFNFEFQNKQETIKAIETYIIKENYNNDKSLFNYIKV